MINEDIKPKDFAFIPEREERKFEENLKDEDPNKYLEYLSIKLLLLYSLRTDILFQDSMFKYVKDEIDSYYLIDLHVYKRTNAARVWGNFDNTKTFVESPEKQKKIRPASSPERLQKKRRTKINDHENGELILPEEGTLEMSKKLPKLVNRKTIGSIKLEPISKPFQKRY